METCTTCGASLRPGARFCTTCGTRVHQQTPDESGWGAVARSVEPDSEQTSVLQAVSAPTPEAASIPATSRVRDWGGSYDTPASSGDPASRFVTALDSDIKPVDDAGWGTPSSSGNDYPTWNFSTTNEDVWKAPEEPVPTDIPTAEEAPVAAETWVAVDTPVPVETPTPVESPVPAEASPSPIAAEEVNDEAATRALELMAELQNIVPRLARAAMDEGAAAMTLTEANLKVSDFSDLQDVIAQVKDDPRDIKALSDLAEKIDRIEALVQEHATLTDAIESALHDLGSA